MFDAWFMILTEKCLKYLRFVVYKSRNFKRPILIPFLAQISMKVCYKHPETPELCEMVQ